MKPSPLFKKNYYNNIFFFPPQNSNIVTPLIYICVYSNSDQLAINSGKLYIVRLQLTQNPMTKHIIAKTSRTGYITSIISKTKHIPTFYTLYVRTELLGKLQNDTVILQKYQDFTVFFQTEPFAYCMFSVLLTHSLPMHLPAWILVCGNFLTWEVSDFLWTSAHTTIHCHLTESKQSG